MTQTDKIPLNKAALIAGVSILMMVLTVPFAEFGIFPTLVDPQSAGITLKNIIGNKVLFFWGILLIFITIICDVIAAWALNIYFAPVNKSLSLLTAWLRLLFAVAYLIALFHLLKILGLVGMIDSFSMLERSHVSDFTLFYFDLYQKGWTFSLVLFGIYLLALGFLAFKASYVPKTIGLCLMIAGGGYLLDSLSKFLMPEINTTFLMITFLGELVFMVWLLIKGRQSKYYTAFNLNEKI